MVAISGDLEHIAESIGCEMVAMHAAVCDVGDGGVGSMILSCRKLWEPFPPERAPTELESWITRLKVFEEEHATANANHVPSADKINYNQTYS